MLLYNHYYDEQSPELSSLCEGELWLPPSLSPLSPSPLSLSPLLGDREGQSESSDPKISACICRREGRGRFRWRFWRTMAACTSSPCSRRHSTRGAGALSDCAEPPSSARCVRGA